MAKKKVEPKGPETREEWIAYSFTGFRIQRFVDTPLPPIPAERNLKVGDQVKIGALENCIIEEIRGSHVCVSYDNKPTRDCANPMPKRIYGSWYWWECPPIETQGGGYVYGINPVIHALSNTSLESLAHKGCEGYFIDNPDYQRGYVWTEEDKQAFIESVFTGLDIGKFVLVEYEYPNNFTEILDGKQRLSTVIDFMLGRIKYKDKFWWNFTWADQNVFTNRMIQYVKLNGNRTSKSERLKLFLEINAGGVPQTEEHLTKVRQLYEDELKKEGK